VHTTMRERITEKLRARILSGQIGPGERLYQDQLAKEFNVSHIPVREALRALSSQGLVTIEAHRGATVSELSRAELQQIVLVRELLECELLTRSIPNMTERDLGLAEKHIDSFRKNPRTEIYPKHNWVFHSALYRAAGLPLVLDTLQRLNDMQQRHLRTERDFDDVSRQHQMLVNLIRAKKPNEAIRFLHEHIRDLLDRLPIDMPPVSMRENGK
jgi:DNA-binding GntR family transcriptional regulator